jgi:hypothetical protein
MCDRADLIAVTCATHQLGVFKETWVSDQTVVGCRERTGTAVTPVTADAVRGRKGVSGAKTAIHARVAVDAELDRCRRDCRQRPARHGDCGAGDHGHHPS